MTQITMMLCSLTQRQTLECEVKCVLGSIITNKASGGDGIAAELFQILKDDAVRDWGQEDKGTTVDEMAGWHYRLDAHEFG